MTNNIVVRLPGVSKALTATHAWSLVQTSDGFNVVEGRVEDRLGLFVYAGNWSYIPRRGPVRVNGYVAHRVVHSLTDHVDISVEADGLPATSNEETIIFGRVGSNADVVIDDPQVKVRHAVAHCHTGGSWRISSLRGDLIVQGEKFSSRLLRPGETFILGSTVLRVPGSHETHRGWLSTPPLTRWDQVEVDVSDITVRYQAGGPPVIDRVSLVVPTHKITAVIGPSGCGKTTLLDAIRAEVPISTGTISIRSEVVASKGRSSVPTPLLSYVPQSVDLHRELSVDSELGYAVKLRVAPDMGRAERRKLAERILGLSDLLDARSARVASLSGGQRMRLSVAVELPTATGLLCLDEPGAGLDPAREAELMENLHNLTNEGRTVLLVTHSIAAFERCDHLVVLDGSGRVAYEGPPSRALTALAADNWTELFSSLKARRRTHSGARTAGMAHLAFHERRTAPAGAFGTLVRRETHLLMLRGPIGLLSLVGLPIVGFLAGMSSTTAGWVQGPKETILTCLFAVIAALVGASLTYAQIPTQLSLIRRDHRVGISSWHVIGSKMIVAVAIDFVVVFLMTSAYLLFRRAGSSPSSINPSPRMGLLLALFSTAAASSAGGLLISALCKTLEQSVTYVTLLSLIQVATNGVLVPLNGLVQWLFVVIPARVGVASQVSFLGGVAGSTDPLWVHASAFWPESGFLLVEAACLAFVAALALRSVLNSSVGLR